MTKREKLMLGAIIALLMIILIGTTFVTSELEHCSSKSNSGETGLKEHTKINVTEYLNFYKESGTHVVFIGRPTCPHSAYEDPILKEIAAEYDITIYYLNTDDNQKDLGKLGESDPAFSEGIATPTIVIFKDKKVAKVYEGRREKEEVVEILKEYNVID